MDKAHGARIAHTLYSMSTNESIKHNLTPQQGRWYVRLDDVKANLAPPGEGSEWYKKVPVSLFFDNDETT